MWAWSGFICRQLQTSCYRQETRSGITYDLALQAGDSFLPGRRAQQCIYSSLARPILNNVKPIIIEDHHSD